VTCFLPDRGPVVADALRARGFALQPHLYLSRPLTAGIAPLLTGEAWSAADLAPAAELLRAAYPGDSGRQFAPHGSWAEWLRYVTNLVEQTGCGALQPALSRVVREPGSVRALALITSLGGHTAHLAQLAVDPAARRNGMAMALLNEAMALAGEKGFEQMTLLVAESNVAAQVLYHSLGFTRRSTFVAARLTRQPLRLTSVAPVSGGMTIRR
jgi:GNAT superfamily N-acetyltransferase